MDNAADNDAREDAPPLGALLAEGREEQGLTRNDVAQRLHMSPSQVEALENGDYARLPKGTFLRGFVRNYAKLIGLDPESVLPLLAENAPRDPAPRIVVPTQNIRFDPLGERFSSPWMKAAASAVVVIGLALAAMYWWLFVRTHPPLQQVSEQSSAPATEPAAIPSPAPGQADPPVPAQAAAPVQAVVPPPPAQASPAPGASAPEKSTSTAAEKAASAAPEKAPTSAPASTAPEKLAAAAPLKAAATAVPGERRLHFRFNGESWVEVRDASGHVIFRQLNASGSEANVSGRPPLQVVVGNAHEVDVERDGRPYDLAPVTDTDVARFKVE